MNELTIHECDMIAAQRRAYNSLAHVALFYRPGRKDCLHPVALMLLGRTRESKERHRIMRQGSSNSQAVHAERAAAVVARKMGFMLEMGGHHLTSEGSCVMQKS